MAFTNASSPRSLWMHSPCKQRPFQPGIASTGSVDPTQGPPMRPRPVYDSRQVCLCVQSAHQPHPFRDWTCPRWTSWPPSPWPVEQHRHAQSTLAHPRFVIARTFAYAAVHRGFTFATFAWTVAVPALAEEVTVGWSSIHIEATDAFDVHSSAPQHHSPQPGHRERATHCR